MLLLYCTKEQVIFYPSLRYFTSHECLVFLKSRHYLRNRLLQDGVSPASARYVRFLRLINHTELRLIFNT